MLDRLAPCLGLAALASTTACSILFDPDKIPVVSDGAVDAPGIDARDPPDAQLPDSDPSMLMISSVTPSQVHEGVGSDGGRPALVVIYAPNVVEAAQVDVAWADAPDPVTFTSAISEGRWLVGLALEIPVISGLDEGQSRDLTVTITQAGISRDATITVLGHDELTLNGASQLDTTGTGLDAQVFSQITIEGPTLTVFGSEPLQLRAYGPVYVNASIDASATDTRPGPHGCAGGPARMPAPCPTAGGGSPDPSGVLDGAGGGGGGFATMGGAGGDGGGAPGSAAGNPMLVPIVSADNTAGNRGHGGGGGGEMELGGGGGPGGHGGGVVAITAGGSIHVMSGAQILVNGGSGGGGGLGGDGGNGSGGAILLRAGNAIEATGSWLRAQPGPLQTNFNSGTGSNGRIRIDHPPGAAASLGMPAPALGPSWAASIPAIVRTPVVDATIRADAGCYGFSPPALLAPATDACTGMGPQAFDRQVSPGGTMIRFDLTNAAIGPQELCAAWTTTAMSTTTIDLPEATSCVEVLYIP